MTSGLFGKEKTVIVTFHKHILPSRTFFAIGAIISLPSSSDFRSRPLE